MADYTKKVIDLFMDMNDKQLSKSIDKLEGQWEDTSDAIETSEDSVVKLGKTIDKSLGKLRKGFASTEGAVDGLQEAMEDIAETGEDLGQIKTFAQAQSLSLLKAVMICPAIEKEFQYPDNQVE